MFSAAEKRSAYTATNGGSALRLQAACKIKTAGSGDLVVGFDMSGKGGGGARGGVEVVFEFSAMPCHEQIERGRANEHIREYLTRPYVEDPSLF